MDGRGEERREMRIRQWMVGVRGEERWEMRMRSILVISVLPNTKSFNRARAEYGPSC